MKEQPELKVYEVATDGLIPYASNAKIHTRIQIEQIAQSIEEFGFNDPIAVWHNEAGETEIIEGHGRVMAAKKLGLEKLPVVYLDHLTDKQRRAYCHIHNQLTLNTDFDFDMLWSELEELSTALDMNFDDFGFDLDFGVDVDDVEDEGLSEDYSQNIGTVTYEPKETNHEVSELYEPRTDLVPLIEKIEDPKMREMLTLRLAWFCDFNFAKIADYYAYQATPEEQRIFEKMGLVLLDRDQLIENGFADIVGSI